MTRHNWTMQQYIDSPALGASKVADVALKSPLDYRHGVSNPTSATTLGTVCHTTMLEPERVDRDYAIWCTRHPDGRRRPKSGKAWEDFAALNRSRTIISDTVLARAQDIAERAKRHPRVFDLLTMSGGEAEISWTWWRIDCPHCGATEHAKSEPVHASQCPKCEREVPAGWRLCKMRPDWETPTDVVDLKTLESNDPRRLINDGFKRGYHFKAPWYLDGAKALGRGSKRFWFLFIQTVAPFDVGLVPVPAGVVELGRRDISAAMRTIAECEASGQWPGQLVDLEHSGWDYPAWQQNEDGLVIGDDHVSL